MNYTAFILTAGLISLLFRVFPLLFVSKKIQTDKKKLFEFFDYAIYAIIGSLIYISAFGEISLPTLIEESGGMAAIKMAILIGAALLSMFFKDIIFPLVISVGICLLINSFTIG